jgi:hypothetical protein
MLTYADDADGSGDLTLAELRQSRHLRSLSDAQVLSLLALLVHKYVLYWYKGTDI